MDLTDAQWLWIETGHTQRLDLAHQYALAQLTRRPRKHEQTDNILVNNFQLNRPLTFSERIAMRKYATST